jgi:hypothetical protein
VAEPACDRVAGQRGAATGWEDRIGWEAAEFVSRITGIPQV